MATVLAAGDSGGAVIRVHPNQRLNEIDPRLYGHFLEHIYNSVVDGLWGQLIRGPSFEEYPTGLGPQTTVVKGNWRFDGADLVGHGRDAHVLMGDPAWNDYTFTVEAQKEDGREGFLIIFRAVDRDNFYWWCLGGWGNERSCLEREVAGKRTELEGTCTDTVIEPHLWYRITVEVAGTSATCYLDGEPVAAFENVGNTHGVVGLGAWRTHVRYRNARVSIDGATAFELGPSEGGGGCISGCWGATPSQPADMTYAHVSDNVLNSASCQYMRSTGSGGGIAQGGLAVTAGATYRGSVWLRGEGVVVAALETAGNREEQRIEPLPREWAPFPLEFAPTATTDKAAFSLALDGPGEAWVDLCTLTREDTPYRPAIFESVRAIRPTFIRWPGGCYAEHYRWQDGVGPAEERVTKPNVAWGGLDPNLFGTAEFVQLCRDVGAEPLMVLNIGHHAPADELDAYVQEAVDWVEYCNGDASTPYGALRARHGYPAPFDVRHWEIGNELWSMAVEAYAERAKRFVEALRKKDERLKFLVCGSAGHDLEWNRRIIELAATHMDYLSTHHYMAGSFEQEMRDAVAYPAFLRKTAEFIASSANPEIRIAVTEWNQMSTTLRTGLYAGLLLNGFERYGNEITMACPALFIRKVTAPEWDNALINHDSNRVFLAPNYLVVKMYRDHLAPVRVAAESPETLDIVATTDPGTGQVVLKIVNPTPDTDVSAQITIDGRAAPRFELQRVHSLSIDDRN